ncbi:MAG: CHAT domain-containing protein [Elusimicrobia bacterium]|nr:CHAT domain-containing protein [Candidatus Liberimonas magnetica]
MARINTHNNDVDKKDYIRDEALVSAREKYRIDPSDVNALKLACAARNNGHGKLFDHFPEQARACFLEALPLYERSKDLYEVFKLKRAIGRAESGLANFPAAITFFEEAIALLEKDTISKKCMASGNLPEMEKAKTQLYLSIALTKTSKWEPALSNLEKARNIFFKHSQNHYLSTCFQGEAVIYMELGRFPEARKAFIKAQEYAKLTGEERRIFHVQEYRAQLEILDSKYKEAIKLLDECIAWYNQSKANRSEPYYQRAKCYEKLNLRKQAAEDYDIAIQITEETRSEIDADEYRQTYFVRKLDIYDGALLNKVVLGDAKGAFVLCQQAKARSFNEKLHSAFRNINEDIDEPELLPLKDNEVSSLLKPKSAFVDYYVTAKKLICFCIAKEGCFCDVSDINSSEIELMVNNVRSFIIQSALPNKDNAEQEAMNWYFSSISNILFGKHAGFLAKKEIIFISPHAHLHYLPFDILNLQGKNIIETHKTAIFPSARTFVEMHKKEHRKIKNSLIVSNPTGDLPSAGSEAQTISGLLSNVTVLEGKDAQKQAILTALPSADLIHFAGHSKADINNPNNSEILVLDEQGGCIGITPQDIIRLKLQAQLVVLSGCESGLGDAAMGDELTCLPRSFLTAGARSVMYSLWDVEDASTSILMKEIYTHIANPGTSVTKALRLAKRKLKASGNPPFHWAGFQLIGL